MGFVSDFDANALLPGGLFGVILLCRVEMVVVILCNLMNVGFRFPLPSIVRRLLCYFSISPAQIKPNGWRNLLGYT